MANNEHPPFTEAEWETLLKAPVLVFLLVSAIDGKVDQKEIQSFQKVLREAATYKSALLRQVLIDMVEKVPALLGQILSAGSDAGKLLSDVKSIVNSKLPADDAKLFKQSLLYIGQQVAESSGGFFGFGSKMSKEEKNALAAVAVILEAA